jgi:hypothetical protein
MGTKGGTDEMNKDVVNKSMLAAAGILVAASMAFAKFPSLDFGRSSKKSADVDIYQTGRIRGGPTLQSGEYKVVLNNNSTTPEIGFYQNGKLVAEVPAKLVDQGKKINETKVYYDTTGKRWCSERITAGLAQPIKRRLHFIDRKRRLVDPVAVRDTTLVMDKTYEQNER